MTATFLATLLLPVAAVVGIGIGAALPGYHSNGKSGCTAYGELVQLRASGGPG